MQSFIVLGIIPGTSIQTTLNFWIAVTLLLTVFILRTRLLAMGNFVRIYLAIRKMAHTIEQYEFTLR